MSRFEEIKLIGKKTLLGLLAALTIGANTAVADNCHDPAEAEQWRRKAREFPQDTVFLRLYALRVGLCRLIDRGELDAERAIELFELARQDAIEQRRREERILDRRDEQPL